MGASTDEIDRQINETRDHIDRNLGMLERRAASNAIRFGRVATAVLGVVAVVTRRNAVGILMGVELLLNAANFDATKLTWLGTITSETSVCATWKPSPVKTWDDMFKREFSLGGSAVGGLVGAGTASRVTSSPVRQPETRHASSASSSPRAR